MATAETVDLGPPHVPRVESVKVFFSLETQLKKELQHLRHDTSKHEPEYFAAVANLSDHQLTDFSEKDLVLVRTAESAYGLHLFGKVRLPHAHDGYIHVRMFVAGDEAKLHSIRTQETEHPDGDKTYRAIFRNVDSLEWFDS